MEPTFDELLYAAERFVEDIHGCYQSQREVERCVNIDDLRRVAMKYRDQIVYNLRKTDNDYIELFDALGIRSQMFVDGRHRLYLAN